jgi:hypothetical protein
MKEEGMLSDLKFRKKREIMLLHRFILPSGFNIYIEWVNCYVYSKILNYR